MAPSPTIISGKLDTRVTISSNLWTLAADASSITTLYEKTMKQQGCISRLTSPASCTSSCHIEMWSLLHKTSFFLPHWGTRQERLSHSGFWFSCCGNNDQRVKWSYSLRTHKNRNFRIIIVSPWLDADTYVNPGILLSKMFTCALLFARTITPVVCTQHIETTHCKK